MDDSEQDFVDLCSKQLKRVRKKESEPSRQLKKPKQQSSSQVIQEYKRRGVNKQDDDSGWRFTASQPTGTGAEQDGVCRKNGFDMGDAALPLNGSQSDRGLKAKDKVLLRMQHFKRNSPRKMVHNVEIQPTNQDSCTLTAKHQKQETPASLCSGHPTESTDSDEALAFQLQQQLNRETAEAKTVDLEDGGLFFCQICHRDLTHMTPEGRTQHLNRCLDESEESGPAPPPPPSVHDCPICGKKFKSQKSRSTHLKRCSSEMGVSPAVLLQALERQAQESQSAATANTLAHPGVNKRKGPSKSSVPARKKPRKKTDPPDEETMMALALSSSMIELEREQQREKEAGGCLQAEGAAPHSFVAPVLKWRTDAGKGRGKKKKVTVPRTPPLLLIQDAEMALARIQERVSALLLRSRSPSPPTPTRCPSTLPGWRGLAPLWQKSALLDGDSTCLSDFYAAELKLFFTPLEFEKTDKASSSTRKKPDSESSVQAVSEGTPASTLLTCSQTDSRPSAPSTPGTGQLSVGSQALRDLMELAEDGMTLTQYGYAAKGNRLSGFIQAESEDQPELRVSGFVAESTQKPSDDTCSRADHSGADKEKNNYQSVALSTLASDLSSMVNNPQLSDVQLQVDTGEVYFAHSFMVYARCPLLAEMIHESGFGVQEEDVPAAQRVLLSDVPGQAVFSLLQYLYTSHCPIPASLQPHMLELASRFDLHELEQLCHLQQEESASAVRDEVLDRNQEENPDSQTDQAFMELLQSMWNEDTEDATDSGGEGGLEEHQQSNKDTSDDRELREEHVNEEELEEIYEFAATQRQKEKDGEEGEKMGGEHGGDADPGLDRSYLQLFSESCGVYDEECHSSSALNSGTVKTHALHSRQHQTPHKASSKLSARTLLQSSASLVDDFSTSPPPCVSNLPVTGLSPGQGGDQEDGGAKDEDAVETDISLKRGTQGTRSICILLSPDSPPKKEEHELIVLSDSSEEKEVDVAVLSPSRLLTRSSSQSYTEIKSRQDPTLGEVALGNQESRSLESSPGPPLDCSPEVSWLIPSTSSQSSRSTRTSSTQTKSSMCRTQLFPRGDSSPPSPSDFSSSPFLKNTKPTPPSNSYEASACAGATESRVSRLKLSRSPLSSSSLDLKFSPKYSCNASKRSGFFESHLSSSTPHHSLHAPSKQDMPLQLQCKPYSSTPLHMEVHQPPVPPAASPLHTVADKQTTSSQRTERAFSESLEETQLRIFHLSPLSNPSDPPSSSSHSRSQQSKRQRNSSSQSLAKSSSSDNSQDGVIRVGSRNEHEEKEMDCSDKEEKEETGEADVRESSFQQSFMDEPPIAFNDSWGLDAYEDANPGRFSLRLEDSEGLNVQESSPRQEETARSSSSSISKQTISNSDVTVPSPPQCPIPRRSNSSQEQPGPSCSPPPPDPNTQVPTQTDNGLLDSKLWDSWVEDKEEEGLPLSQRVTARLKTPASLRCKRRRPVVPITPMPHYSDMDTPELKNKLNRFGVRPLPKRQMILKLKEIHQYTHQLASSDSDDEVPQAKPPTRWPTSCAQAGKFKEPRAPAATSPGKDKSEEDVELLSASQGSNTSSTAASEESERSNPEQVLSSDGDSDSESGISSSQVASRLQDRLQAVRSFILSNSNLYNQILEYKPLVLSQLQAQLKEAGIRLGAAKLVDYLDSQCITFTTAKPGQSGWRGRRTAKGARRAGRKNSVLKL